MPFQLALPRPAMRKENPRAVLLHVAIWMTLMLLPYLTGSSENGYRIGALPGWYFNVFGIAHAGLFYANANVLFPRLMTGRAWWIYLFSAVMVVAAVVHLKFLFLNLFLPDSLGRDSTLGLVVLPTVGIMIASLIYRVVVEKSLAEQEQGRRTEDQLRMRIRILQSEINPHFLFNAFTSVASLAKRRSDRLERAIITLAEITRYLHFNSGEKTTVEHELECLENYIALQKLRFCNHISIEYAAELRQDQLSLDIEPMLLLPFIENAFKHGTFHDGKTWVRIVVALKNRQLTMTVENPCQPNADGRKGSASMGLRNVRDRLNLLYANSHTLAIRETGNTFHVHLTLELHDTINDHRR